LRIDAIRDCFEGAIPSVLATCAPDGTPNVTYVSQVHFVDSSHVAMSFQFFNKTRENILANPRASAIVIHPFTAEQFRLNLEYIRTEESGPLFENMKAKLAGIASHTGMAKVFRLRGSDIYHVLDVTAIPGNPLPTPDRFNRLSGLRTCVENLTNSSDLAKMLDDTLAGLEKHFGAAHSMILMVDSDGKKLYTLVSRGYADSGIGSEIAIGYGIIGVAAAQRAPIRITHMTAEYSYGLAIRESMLRAGLGERFERTIPFPGLAEARSQLAVPILASGQLLGVLYVESSEDLRFSYDDEDALVALTGQLGIAMRLLQQQPDASVEVDAKSSGTACTVRHYPADDSIFIDDDYLIKGVAGAIFYKLLRNHAETQRQEFSNKELRIDPALRLPDVTDNLEARLILLQRRLTERKAPMRIEKTGRGKFRLHITRPFRLLE
jgi:adenylate cyclase